VGVGRDIVDEHVRRRPAESLRPYIGWYSGYRQRGVPPALHRGLPSPFLTLIFTLDEPLTIVEHPIPSSHRMISARLSAACTPARR
jgi:hypothetical protein